MYWSQEEELKKPEVTKPEDKISCNGIELEKVEAGSGGEYVYDVYYHRRHPAIKAGEFEIFSPDCIDQVRRGSEKFCLSYNNQLVIRRRYHEFHLITA